MSDLRLRPMTEAEFTAFARRAAREYAEVQVAAGNWDPDQAPTLAERSFAEAPARRRCAVDGCQAGESPRRRRASRVARTDVHMIMSA